MFAALAFSVAALAMFAAGIWLVIEANAAAADAAHRYGHNVDSGALEFFVAIVYCVPAALLLAVAALSLWRQWRLRLLAQIAAILWVVGLPGLDALRLL
jgi:hypothetical protein